MQQYLPFQLLIYDVEYPDGKESMKKLSIKDVSVKINGEDENLLYGQFLDDFYSEKNINNKYNLIKDEPVFDKNNRVFMTVLAGTAHKLAKDYGVKIPEWVFDDKYVLDEVHYAFDTKNIEFQEYLRNTTPTEYKSRNLMSGDTILKRC